MPATAATRRFTVDEYYRMAEAGILAPDERVELIEGEIVRMAAIGSRHAACVRRLDRILSGGVGDPGRVSVQSPVRLGDVSEPEPDIAVLRSRADDYAGAHPGPEDVLLIVEVADTTVDYDREVKGPLYAAAGISEYWLVNIPEGTIEVHREPSPDGYRKIRRCGRGDVLRAIGLPQLEVPVPTILS